MQRCKVGFSGQHCVKKWQPNCGRHSHCEIEQTDESSVVHEGRAELKGSLELISTSVIYMKQDSGCAWGIVLGHTNVPT